jgi:saccharopine dehydrogenase-like NADP-dependent oxidoreductase
MRVRVIGTDQKGIQREITYSLYDEYNPETQTSSMARTTGYTAAAAVNLIVEGIFTEKGAFPPELVGKHENCFNHFMSYLRERGVIYKRTEKVIES